MRDVHRIFRWNPTGKFGNVTLACLHDIGQSESEVNVMNKKDNVKKPEQKPNKPTPKK